MSYKIEWKDKGLLIRYSDTLSTKDLIRASSEFIGDPRVEAIEYIISDLSNVKDTNVNKTDVVIVKDFAVRTNPINPRVKVAVVATTNNLIRLAESFVSMSTAEIRHADYRVFLHIDEATAWVNP